MSDQRPAAPHNMKIVLVTPEIPGNTGSVGRTCVALDMELILIRPYGFDITEKSVRRAGLDYWKHVRLSEYDTWDGFIAARGPQPEQMFFFENDSAGSAYEAEYPRDAYLVFGRETKGIQPEILESYPDRIFGLPMFSPHIRSLNLANSATAAAYLAMRGHVLGG